MAVKQGELIMQGVETITRIEYKGQPVLTYEQLAEVLSSKGDREVTVKSLRENFRNNRERFIEGGHYFKLEGEELKTFMNYTKNFGLVPKNAKHLYLLTRRGVARHCKMVNSEVAWDVYEALEENYFNPPAEKQIAILECERLEVEKMQLATEQARLEVERERLALERDNFAKAQLLRELASASGDNQLMRNDLIRQAKKLLIGEVKGKFDDEFDDDVD